VTALRRQIENFCRAVRGVEPLLISAEDAIASVEVMEAAYSSLRENHWAPVLHHPDSSAGEPAARPATGPRPVPVAAPAAAAGSVS